MGLDLDGGLLTSALYSKHKPSKVHKLWEFMAFGGMSFFYNKLPKTDGCFPVTIYLTAQNVHV